MTYNEEIAHNQKLSDNELESIYNGYIQSCNIILFISISADAIMTVFGGDIEVKIGPTKTLLLASICITFGFGFTYFGLLYNSIIIIGISFAIFGSGVGIGYPVHPIVCMRWFPQRMGVVNGLISAVFGCGPFVFDAIQSKLVNPLDIALDDRFGYTKESEIIQRIPFMFMYVAGIMFTMQLISILAIKNPPWFLRVDDAHKSKTQLLYEANSLTVKQSIKCLSFWELWCCNLFFTLVLMWLIAEWKVFAVSYLSIHNDSMLSLIGSLGSLSNGFGRFLWGIFYDYSGSFRVSMGLQTILCAIFVSTLPFIGFIRWFSIESVFTFWMIVMWFCAGCEYAFLPSCISQTFGAKHTGALIGIFVMAEPLAMAIVVLLSASEWLQENYEYYCIVIGGFCAISTVLSVLHKPNRIKRKKSLNQSFAKVKKYDSFDTV